MKPGLCVLLCAVPDSAAIASLVRCSCLQALLCLAWCVKRGMHGKCTVAGVPGWAKSPSAASRSTCQLLSCEVGWRERHTQLPPSCRCFCQPWPAHNLLQDGWLACRSRVLSPDLVCIWGLLIWALPSTS